MPHSFNYRSVWVAMWKVSSISLRKKRTILTDRTGMLARCYFQLGSKTLFKGEIFFSGASETIRTEDIPTDYESLVETKRQELIEQVSGADEQLGEMFLGLYSAPFSSPPPPQPRVHCQIMLNIWKSRLQRRKHPTKKNLPRAYVGQR